MSTEQILSRVIHDAIAIDTIYSVRYQVSPTQSIIQQGWFRKEYELSTTVEGKEVQMLVTYEIHYHDFDTLVVLPIIEIIVSASAPHNADHLSSMLFKCRGNENGTATITYSPEKETYAALQDDYLFDKAIQKICNDIDLNLAKGALRYFILELNQLSSSNNSTEDIHNCVTCEDTCILSSDSLSQCITVGNCIKIGRYPQGANGEIEDIEWIILEKKDNTALLISRYAIECMRFTENFVSSWTDSTLRNFLNTDFLQSAFNHEELNRILDTECSNTHEIPDVQGEPNTVDKIFCLSIEEANQYFDSDQSRAAKPTEYAKEQGAAQQESTGNCLWWLRSMGNMIMNYSNVDFNGKIKYNMIVLSDGALQPMLSRYYTVRPAMRIKL